jgi:hypothetical protein
MADVNARIAEIFFTYRPRYTKLPEEKQKEMTRLFG